MQFYITDVISLIARSESASFAVKRNISSTMLNIKKEIPTTDTMNIHFSVLSLKYYVPS